MNVISSFCENYIEKIRKIPELTKNDRETNAKVVLVVASFFTVIIPVSVACWALGSYYYGEMAPVQISFNNKKELLVSNDEETNLISKEPVPQVHSYDGRSLIPIHKRVKPTLEQLFENSSYSLDTLPVYPLKLFVSLFPRRELMAAPIMKGILDDIDSQRAFIAIKVKAETVTIPLPWQPIEHDKRDLIYLVSDEENPLKWEQKLCKAPVFSTRFFFDKFTDELSGAGPTETQKEGFALLQQLLRTGEGKDLYGNLWKIDQSLDPVS